MIVEQWKMANGMRREMEESVRMQIAAIEKKMKQKTAQHSRTRYGNKAKRNKQATRAHLEFSLEDEAQDNAENAENAVSAESAENANNDRKNCKQILHTERNNRGCGLCTVGGSESVHQGESERDSCCCCRKGIKSLKGLPLECFPRPMQTTKQHTHTNREEEAAAAGVELKEYGSSLSPWHSFAIPIRFSTFGMSRHT